MQDLAQVPAGQNLVAPQRMCIAGPGVELAAAAIGVGEPFRAGRWWWEDEAAKECGLHVKPAAAQGTALPEKETTA